MTTDIEFLPEGYEAPKSGGGYTKLEIGETRLRFLSKPIFGWVEWAEKKPYRYRAEQKPNEPKDKKEGKLTYFLTAIVWNYKDNEIQVCEIKQASVRKRIEELAKDSDWGAPYHYDIKISRKGEGKETEYSVNPAPKKPISKEIVQAFQDKPVALEALYSGADPFSPKSEAEITPLFSEKKEIVTLSVEQQEQLQDALGDSDVNRTAILSYFGKKQGAKEALNGLSHIDTRYFEAALNFAKQPKKAGA